MGIYGRDNSKHGVIKYTWVVKMGENPDIPRRGDAMIVLPNIGRVSPKPTVVQNEPFIMVISWDI